MTGKTKVTNGIIYILWIFLAWSIYVAMLYAKVDPLSEPFKIIINESIRFLIFAATAVLIVFHHQASYQQLGLMGIQTKGISSALLICLSYVVIASCIAIFVQNKTFKLPCSYSFWVTAFSISTIIEEICFRGILFFLFSQLNKKILVIITSVAFSGIHFPGLYLFPIHPTSAAFATDAIAIFILGCILGWIYLKTRSIWCTSCLHSINNLLAAGFA